MVFKESHSSLFKGDTQVNDHVGAMISIDDEKSENPLGISFDAASRRRAAISAAAQ